MLTVTVPDEPVETARRFLAGFTRPGPLIVAISGGSDSTALLLALHEACRIDAAVRRPLIAVTVDHALRAGSAEEARAVARLCAGLSVAHRTAVWRGEKPASGLQAAARMARYRLLADIAQEAGAVGIVTAHTRDDQTETVLMRAARGIARELSPGLAGMAPATLFECRAWILRPFLARARADLRRWLAEQGRSWIDDPSNADPRFERVRVRPRAAAEDVTADIARATQARHRRAADLAAMIDETAKLHGGFILSVTAGRSLQADPNFHQAVAMLMTLAGGRSYAPSQDALKRLSAFVEAGRPGRMNLAGAMADLRRDACFIYRERRGIRPVTIAPGAVAVFDGRYRVDNAEGCIPVELGVPGGDGSGAVRDCRLPGVPAGVVDRALAAEPAGLPHYGRTADDAGPSVTRHLAPFDVFLPLFDRTLADRCAALFARAPYAPPPIAM